MQGLFHNPFSPQPRAVDPMAQFQILYGPSFTRLVNQKQAIQQALNRVIGEKNHSPASLYDLRLQQYQLVYETKLVRVCIQQQGGITDHARLAENYLVTHLEELYQEVKNISFQVLAQQQEQARHFRDEAKRESDRTCRSELLGTLDVLQLLRLETVIPQVTSASLQALEQQISSLWNVFVAVVLQGDHSLTSVARLHVEEHQLQLEAKRVRTIILRNPAQAPMVAKMNAERYMELASSLYYHVTNQTVTLLAQGSQPNQNLYAYRVSADLSFRLMRVLNEIRTEGV